VSIFSVEPIAVPIHSCYQGASPGYAMARKPTQIVQLKLRIRERQRAAIERRAKKSGRSLNGEIEAMLELALVVGDWHYIRQSMEALIQSMERSVEISAERYSEIAAEIEKRRAKLPSSTATSTD
jgi:hypothetical protein